MNQKSLRVLEFNKIIELLKSKASSSLGLKYIEELVPSSDFEEVKYMQQETSETQSILTKRGYVGLQGIHDIEDKVKRAGVGASLDPGSLIMIADTLRAARTLRNSLSGSDEEDFNYPIIQSLSNGLYAYREIEDAIYNAIISELEISDNASSTLRDIRRRIVQKNQSIRSKLNSIISSTTYQKYLQDAIISVRGDRFVVPIKAEYRSQVAGIVHDQSSSGATLFIEPMSIVDMNNELRQLRLSEQEEIERILQELSAMVGEVSEDLISNQEILGRLDFAFAKGALALDMNASRPVFNTEGRIRIREGRHPLLDRKKVVPISLTLGDTFDLLVITGPNTGGKTVSLKTVGLFTLMGQAGLHIPALDRSELAVFNQVYADIGDEQSIEQSLSTFSSHMTNVVSFLNHVDENSLVLFDELGAGTDPTEGAALAIAILSHLHNRGIRTMATTHYSELKVFALSTPGVENACCEFDVETLSPTYHLLIGIPGKSNAFAISEKLGLPDYIIQDAKTHLTEEDESFEDLLTDLEQSRKTIEKEREEVASYRREMERLKSELKNQQEKLDTQRDRIIREANARATDIVQEAKDFADETMKNFRKFGKASISASEMEKERERIRKQLSKTENKNRLEKKKPSKAYKASDFHLGDSVKVLSMNLTGTVNSLPDAKGNLFVQMGILRSQVNISDLELIEEPLTVTAKQMRRTSSGKMKMGKSMHVSPEINLLGKTVDEAVAELDKYLDDAYIAHLSPVRIVHGKGTGALRNGIHQYLRRQKHIKSFRLGAFGEGDAGVTIVEFK